MLGERFGSPLRLVGAYVVTAERLHADDTAVPVLAKGKTDMGRCGAGPPAAMFYYSRDRKGEHPQGIWPLCRHLQDDAYDDYNQLYLAGRNPGPIREAAWSHARRPFLPWPISRGMRDARPPVRRNPALANRDRSRTPDRCAVRGQAIHQWHVRASELVRLSEQNLRADLPGLGRRAN